MLFATVGQGARFLWMALAGVFIGAWYLSVWLLRRFIQAGFYLTLLCDLLFGAGCAALFILFLVLGSYGQVRLFDISGALLGSFAFTCAFLPSLKKLRRVFLRMTRQIIAVLTKNRLIKIIFR